MERAQSTDQGYFERLLSKARRPAMQGRSQALSKVSLFHVQLRIRLSIVTLLVALLIFRPGLAEATVWIANDPGGSIVRYIYRYERLRASGQKVVIDGFCASACTIVLAAIPPGRICVTQHAELAFHAAWKFGPRMRRLMDTKATRLLFSIYPAPVRRWITLSGGLTRRTVFLRGNRLAAMYRTCLSSRRRPKE